MFSTARIAAVVVLIGIFCGSALAENPPMVFGVKPGILAQSSYVGVGLKRTEPFIGIDWVGFSVDADGADAQASLLIPHLGLKYFLKDYRQAGNVAPYLLGDIFFSIPSVDFDNFSPSEEEATKDLLGFWGLGLAFGAEYFFTDAFSVGGEYGLRYLRTGVEEQTETYPDWNGQPHTRTVQDEFSFAFKITYVAITANFFF